MNFSEQRGDGLYVPGIHLCFAIGEGRSEDAAVDYRLETMEDGAIWTVAVGGGSSLWSAPLTWRVAPDQPAGWRWWMPWDGPHNPMPVGESMPRKEYDYTPDGGSLDTWSWRDPFVPQPLGERALVYGAHPSHGAGFAIPLLMLLPPDGGDAWSVLFAPDNDLLEFRAQADAAGVTFTDRYQRLGSGRTQTYRLHVYRHVTDWRAALAVAVRRFPRFFEPGDTGVGELTGFGAYTASSELPPTANEDLGRIVNWRASFDFPYIGKFLPEEPEWTCINCLSDGRIDPYRKDTASVAVLNAYATALRQRGHRTLAYFNTTEFGFGIRWPQPDQDESFTYAAARDSNRELWSRFPEAILFGCHEPTNGPLFRSPAEHHDLRVRFHERPYWSWGDCIVMDPGDPAWAAHLVAQAEAIATRTPAFDGIAIDRCDWLQEYNYRADDGGTLIAGRPARALVRSWKALLPRLAGVLHPRGKAIFASLSDHRLDMAEYVDGIFHEGGYYGPNLNLSSFLGLFKPVLVWSHPMTVVERDGQPWFRVTLFSGRQIEEPVDAFFQRHLFMGAWPMAPVVGNDHSLGYDPAVAVWYKTYAPLFQSLRGRQWVLEPAAVIVDDGAANVFRVPFGLVVVVMGHPGRRATVSIADTLIEQAGTSIAFTPVGCREVAPPRRAGDRWLVELPLDRGCSVWQLALPNQIPTG